MYIYIFVALYFSILTLITVKPFYVTYYLTGEIAQVSIQYNKTIMFQLRPHTKHRIHNILNKTLEKKISKVIRKISEDKRIFEDIESSIDCDIK